MYKKIALCFILTVSLFCTAPVSAQMPDTDSIPQAIAEHFKWNTLLDKPDRGTFTLDNAVISFSQRDNEFYIVRVVSADAELCGLVNMNTRTVAVPFEYSDLFFIPNSKLLGVIATSAGAVKHYEVDYYGNTTPVFIEGDIAAVERETGYVTLVKKIMVNCASTEANAAGTEIAVYLHALLDNHYHWVLDYIVEAHEPTGITFQDDMAVIKTCSTEWVGDFRGFAGNGKYGVIDRAGTYLLASQYDTIAYTGTGKFDTIIFDETVDENGVRTFCKASVTVTVPRPQAPSFWAADTVANAIALGIVPAKLQTNYTQSITRAEFCALAVAMYERTTGAPITARAAFTDSTDINVQKLGGINVVGGTGNGAFSPDAPLNREQAAVILANLSAALGQPLVAAGANFADTASAADWALPAIGQTQAAGILNGIGDNLFAPKTAYTREQSIVTIINLLHFVE